MKLKLTAGLQKFPEGDAAFVKELPVAHLPSAPLAAARANLAGSVVMGLEASRELAESGARWMSPRHVGQDVKVPRL